MVFTNIRRKNIRPVVRSLKTSDKNKGITCIVNSENTLIAVITDGDIRRILLSEKKPIASLFVDDVIDMLHLI